MGKTSLLTGSNFRKNRGTSVGLFLLILIASMLIAIVMLAFTDAYPTAGREAERLNAGDGFIMIGKDIDGFDDEVLADIFAEQTKEYQCRECLAYANISLEFGNGTIAPTLIISDASVLDDEIDRIEIIEEDSSIEKDYVYVPYQFHTGGGYEIGDKYSFEIYGEKIETVIKGFINTTYFGCNNNGIFLFIVDDARYDKLSETGAGIADGMIINYILKDDVKISRFRIKTENDLLAVNANSILWSSDLANTLFNKSFMSLIIAVSFLVVVSIMVVVIVMMLANTISNYTKENMETIGALKAIGYTGNDIRASLVALFGSLSIGGTVCGIAASYLLMPVMAQIFIGQMGVPYSVGINAVSIITPVLGISLLVLITTLISTKKINKINPIVALRSGTENHSYKKNSAPLDRLGFNLNFSLAMKTFATNMKQNVITFVVVAFLMFICVMALLMFENFNRNPQVGILTFEICGGVLAVDNEVKDEVRDYLEDRSDATNIRNMMNLTINYKDEDRLNAYVFDDPDKMNNREVCYKGRFPKYDNEIAVSGKFAKEYGFEIGDEINMVYGDSNYDYLITGFIQTCNNSGREALMSMEAMNHLIDVSDIGPYYWFDCDGREVSQGILDDVAEKYGSHVSSTMNFYEMLDGSMTTFKGISTLMLVMVCSVAAAIILLVLYLLIKALVYNKRRDYGIYKAIGFTSGSLILQTAISFMPSIVAAVVVSSFVSYYLANPYMTLIMGTFGLMKCTFDIPVVGVVIIGVVMIILAFLFSVLNSSKIKKIEPYNLLTAE